VLNFGVWKLFGNLKLGRKNICKSYIMYFEMTVKTRTLFGDGEPKLVKRKTMTGH